MGGPTSAHQNMLERILGSGEIVPEEEFKINIDEFRREAWEGIQTYRKLSTYINRQRGLLLATPSIWPAFGHVTSPYGWRIHPITKRKQFHKGIDIANIEGTPIRVAADGRVVLTGWEGSYGKLVVIDHSHGFSTRYGHNSKILVKPGQRVKRGQVIALMGNTGMSTGPHLYYEIWYKGKALNPRRYLTRK